MEVACLVIPDFPVALARRDEPALRQRPIVVGGSPEEHAQVRACSQEAREAGVAIGTTLRRALALCPAATFLPWRETQVRDEDDRIVRVLEEQSPVVEAIAPGHAHFDVRGLARLAGCEDAVLLRRIQDVVAAASGLGAALAGADTVFTAHAAASAGCAVPVVVSSEASQQFLAGLPVETLPVPPSMHERLKLFGLSRLGDVAALPLSALQAQFGRDGARAWELANGQGDARIVPRQHEVVVTRERELPAPTPLLEPLVVGTRSLLEQALLLPEVRGYLLRRLDWAVILENGEVIERRVVFREPTNDAAHMQFVLRNKIERLQLPAAAASLRIQLSGLCSEYGQQAPLWRTGPKRQRELLAAIEQLNARVEGPQVYRIVEVQPWSRIPERQLALMPYGR